MLPNKQKKVQFTVERLYPEPQLQSVTLLVQRYSFWVAALSIFSFVVGNLVGQHGWYAVYKSVMGRGIEQQIVFSGTVTPIDQVPDYVAWAQYGGNSRDHTFRQVPSRLLVPLPPYNPSTQNNHLQVSTIGQIYSVGHNGSYKTGGHGDGYHPGIDIRVPIGTPVRSIANGIVTEAGAKNGYGNTIVVKHPNVPDPNNPTKTTTLYSAYAHLSSIHVRIDDVVSKGELIGLSGNTGNSSGPHLHFQMDRDTAPWHPYWPNGNDRSLSELYTFDPLTYVQSHPISLVATSTATTTTSQRAAAPEPEPELTDLADRAAARRAARLAERKQEVAINTTETTTITRIEPVAEQKSVLGTSTITEAKTVVASIDIRHDGDFEPREKELVRIRLLDIDGNRVDNPLLTKDIYLKTAYGEATFDKPILKESDFTDGEAIVYMRSNSRRTVVIKVEPYGNLSKPLSLEH